MGQENPVSDKVFPPVLHLFMFLIYISDYSVIFLRLVSSLEGALFLPLNAVMVAVL